MWWITNAYLSVVAVMSVVALVCYGLDKRRAVHGGWRISEKTLHVISLLGGWPGALIGQRIFRHKTVKLRFRLVLWGIVAVHALVILVLLTKVSRFGV